jgi:hypothetical protein
MMEEMADMEDGHALMWAMHDGRGDRHGRVPGIDEGPCMNEEVTVMEEGQAWKRAWHGRGLGTEEGQALMRGHA